MKKILLSLLALSAFVACQKPQYVLPTVERQGITSLTAYFTTGQFANQELAKLVISDPEETYYTIEIPWFFPEDSENPTLIAMTRVKLQAELAPNCKIEPPLGIVDLSDENKYVFTNPQGERRNIIITGRRVKSSKTVLESFSLVEPVPVEGFIDEGEGIVYLFTKDDLAGCTATASASSHATISTDLSVPRDYNVEQIVTVVAFDGKTKQDWKIIKKEPEKIPYGYNAGSEKQLFNFDPVSRLGLPDYTHDAYPSLGSIENKLVICLGDGSTPVYINGFSGKKEGTIALGSAPCAAITSDDAGHLLLMNHAEGGQDLTIWSTSSVTEAPTLYYTYNNPTDTPVGYHVRVCGDIAGDAQIILTHEGIEGVTGCGKYTRLVVSGGAVVEVRECSVQEHGLLWASAPTRAAKVAPAGPGADDGEIFSWYGDNYNMYYVSATGNLVTKDLTVVDPVTADNSWGYNYNCLDAKLFNGQYLMSHLITSHFPEWGYGPCLYLYDMATPSLIKSASPIFKDTNIEWYNIAAHTYGAADVVMAPSKDGFRLFIFYYDYLAQSIGGYTMDCIKR